MAANTSRERPLPSPRARTLRGPTSIPTNVAAGAMCVAKAASRSKSCNNMYMIQIKVGSIEKIIAGVKIHNNNAMDIN